MINISEKEFINYLERYADNEISMGRIVEDLQSDYRTIYNRIIMISITNPDLYNRIITSHPYEQKSRSDIDFEALMIYIIKQGITTRQAEEIFNVSRRTIDRRANKIKESDLDLYELFRICTGKNRRLINDPQIQEKIKRLEYKDVVIAERNEEREKFLLDIERRYNELILTGITKEEAAKKMGYSRDYINNVLDELYRLEIEKNVRSANNHFRKSLSDMTKYTPADKHEHNSNTRVDNKSNDIENNNEAR